MLIRLGICEIQGQICSCLQASFILHYLMTMHKYYIKKWHTKLIYKQIQILRISSKTHTLHMYLFTGTSIMLFESSNIDITVIQISSHQ